MSSSYIKSDLIHLNPDLQPHYRHHHHDDHDDEDQTAVVTVSAKRPPPPQSSSSSTSTTVEQSKGVKAGRGKTQIKLIQNQTNRQVTYSKRRSGIVKKASELAILCDAKVSLILISHNSNKMHHYISDNTTTKEMIDMYQKSTDIDVWKPHYERMQQELRLQKEKNDELKRQIRQRRGYDLEDLSFDELRALEDNMSTAVENIRSKMYHKLKNQTETTRKRVKSHEDRNITLLQNYQAKCEDPPYGLVVDNADQGLGYVDSPIALANGAYTFRHGHHHGHGQIGGGEFDPYNAYDLRLAW